MENSVRYISPSLEDYLYIFSNLYQFTLEFFVLVDFLLKWRHISKYLFIIESREAVWCKLAAE